MSPLPDVTQTVEDFGLGVVPAGAGSASLAIGTCVGGVSNTVYGFGSTVSAKSRLKKGLLLESVISKLSAGAPAVYAVRATPSTFGVCSAVTKVGTGTGVLTVAPGPHATVLGKVTTGGVLGTMQMAFSVDGGAYGTPITSLITSWVTDIADTFLRATFPAGTYVLNEIYTFATDGTVTQSGAGPVATAVASPIDIYSVIVEIMSAGARGVGTFRYSLDGGDTYSGTALIPSNGVFVIADSGVVLTFSAATHDLGTLHTFTTTTATYSTSDMNTAMDAATTDQSQWGMVHIVGAPASAASAASLAAAVASKMDAAAVAFRYARAVVECPSTEADSAISSAFAASSHKRVGVAVGDFEHNSPLTGRINRRNAAWAFMARVSGIAEAEAPHFVGRGALEQVRSLYRNEFVTPLLDNARFITLRTFAGQSGYYITRGRLMAPAGSDFTFWANGRVMDRACTIARTVGLPIVGASVRVNATTGKILDKEAKRIEKRIQRAIEADLVARGQVSAVQVVVDRDNNILATQTVNVGIGIIPKGYADFLTQTLQFVNPASL